ncbi:MAG: pseudouridine synthase [Chloroflexi bacterium]|nr:pseudouridine synthase [Chloroflexota bacterium]MCL5274344.1 pseudouridine synthase [Chloroflexota bacterium]
MNIAFYKPYGVLSSFTYEATSASDAGKRTLSEFGLPAGVYAAGRLDYDSEGLLILSDDGGFIHRLTDPRYKLPKTYYAQVEGSPTPAALASLRDGVAIKGFQTQPCEAGVLAEEPHLPPRDKPITPHGPTAWLQIVLREGKKRQVRHMTAYVGLPTLRLARVAIGPVTLAGLLPGRWRELTAKEMRQLQPRAAQRIPTS